MMSALAVVLGALSLLWGLLTEAPPSAPAPPATETPTPLDTPTPDDVDCPA